MAHYGYDSIWDAVFGVVVLFILIFAMISVTQHGNEDNSACARLGFEDYRDRGGMTYCEDSEGNLHYVKLECVGMFFVKCTAKPISVGDVRVIKND